MIFWKHIKGLNRSTSSDALWSFIRFKKKVGTSQVESTKFGNVPELHLNTTDDDSADSASCGHFITQKAVGQSIDTPFTFNSTLTANDHIYLKGGKYFYLNGTDANTYLAYTSSNIYMNSASGINLTATNAMNLEAGNHMGFTVPSETYKFSFYGAADSTSWCDIVKGALIMHYGYIKASSSSGGYIEAGTYLKAASYCEAKYFNATSDRRAKTDIQPLLIDALELVKKTTLYSFKYKETDTPSIGIIAQDVQDIDINGFKLVDNEEATGKDLDYMTIHESKLTYILWKAVQEQQKIIDDLKKEIDELKKN